MLVHVNVNRDFRDSLGGFVYQQSDCKENDDPPHLENRHRVPDIHLLSPEGQVSPQWELLKLAIRPVGWCLKGNQKETNPFLGGRLF